MSQALNYGWLLLLLSSAVLVSLVASSSANKDDLDLDLESEDENYDDANDSERQSDEPSSRQATRNGSQIGVTECGRVPLRGGRQRPRVLWGKTIELGEFPSFVHLVSFHEYGKDQETCGGTLISDRHILTAMHCTDPLRKGKKMYAILGDLWQFRVDLNEVIIKVKRLVCSSPKYVPGDPKHDWAIVELETPATMNSYVQPACLPRSPATARRQRDDSKCFLVGFGISRFENQSDSSGVRPDTLQKLRVVENFCEPEHDISPDDPSQVCYQRDDGRSGGNLCFGDSGGPVICQDYQGRHVVTAIAIAVKYELCGMDSNDIIYKTKAIYTDVVKLLSEMDTLCGPLLTTKRPVHDEFSDITDSDDE